MEFAEATYRRCSGGTRRGNAPAADCRLASSCPPSSPCPLTPRSPTRGDAWSPPSMHAAASAAAPSTWRSPPPRTSTGFRARSPRQRLGARRGHRQRTLTRVGAQARSDRTQTAGSSGRREDDRRSRNRAARESPVCADGPKADAFGPRPASRGPNGMETSANCDISRVSTMAQKYAYVQEKIALKPLPLAVLKIVVSPGLAIRESPGNRSLSAVHRSDNTRADRSKRARRPFPAFQAPLGRRFRPFSAGPRGARAGRPRREGACGSGRGSR
jgi:hypothetical protein